MSTTETLWCPQAKADVTVTVHYTAVGESVNALCRKLGLRALERREPTAAEKVVAAIRERGVSGDFFAVRA